jgi:hypothetical protein
VLEALRATIWETVMDTTDSPCVILLVPPGGVVEDDQRRAALRAGYADQLAG